MNDKLPTFGRRGLVRIEADAQRICFPSLDPIPADSSVSFVYAHRAFPFVEFGEGGKVHLVDSVCWRLPDWVPVVAPLCGHGRDELPPRLSAEVTELRLLCGSCMRSTCSVDRSIMVAAGASA